MPARGRQRSHRKTVEGFVVEKTCGAGPCSSSAGQAKSPLQLFSLQGELLLAVQPARLEVDQEGVKREQFGQSSQQSSSLILLPQLAASLPMDCATMPASNSW